MAFHNGVNTSDIAATVPDDPSYSNQDEFTVTFWIRHFTQTNGRRWMRKSGDIGSKQVQWISDTNDCQLFVDRSITDAVIHTSENFATAVWYFMVFAFRLDEVAQVFWGTRDSKPVEANYGATQTAGSGNIVQDSGNDLGIGARLSHSTPVQSDIAMFQWFNKKFTAQDSVEQWHEPHVTPEMRIWHLYDEPPQSGLSVVKDLSGWGNHGVPTGVTWIEHQEIQDVLRRRDDSMDLWAKQAAVVANTRRYSLALTGVG